MIKEIHREAIVSGEHDETYYIDLVRDEGTLEYISERLEDIDDCIQRAAFVLFSVANYHPFTEGNKRTAVLLAEVVLGANLSIDVDADGLNKAVRRIGSPEGSSECTEKWLRKHIKRIS